MAFAIGRSKRKTFSLVRPGRRSVEDAKSSLKAMDSGKIVREEDGFLLQKACGPGRDLSLALGHSDRSHQNEPLTPSPGAKILRNL